MCAKCTGRWRFMEGQREMCVCVSVYVWVCVWERERKRERVGHIIREIVSPVWVERLCAAVSLQRRSSMRRTQLDTLSSLSGVMGKWEGGTVWSLCVCVYVCGCARVSVCVRACVFAGPGAKLARDVFSHLTRPTSKCHKWAEIRDEAMLFYGPILAWDIIMTGPVTMAPCFHSRGGVTEGRESRK